MNYLNEPFEQNVDYVLDGRRFVGVFLVLVKNQRDLQQQLTQKIHEKLTTRRIHLLTKAPPTSNSIYRYEALQDIKYTKEQEETAEQKIRDAAFNFYDSTRPICRNLNCFQTKYLEPGNFREIMKQTFDVKLSPCELKVILDKYDTDSIGMISSYKFMFHLERLLIDIQDRKINSTLKNRQKLIEKEKKIQESEFYTEQEKSEKEELEKRLHIFSKKDIDSALKKITGGG